MKKPLICAIQNYCNKKYNQMFEEIINKYHVTQIEIDVLAFLANNPEYKYAQDIVNVRCISKGHVSMAVDNLCKKRLLERVPDEKNRRCNLLFITDKARDIVNDIRAQQKIYNSIAYKDFSEEEMKQFLSFLNRTYKNLGGRSDD